MMDAKAMAERISAYEADHAPDGWPAVQMSFLSDCRVLLEQQAAELEALRNRASELASLATDNFSAAVTAQEERDALRADAERLDWIEKHKPIVFCPHNVNSNVWTLYLNPDGEDAFEGDGLRAAIDAALAGSGNG